ncbi:hypothetical protein ACMGDK_11520 [Chryseobacterium sp. DT-3]|uniref:hypothetical protein n=1 Tax=Chryseobacterium sp. DT-3 TaxID=3396164 RepID=UPI003F1A57CD
MKKEWKHTSLYPPPKDKPLLTKDLNEKEQVLKWNGTLWQFQGKGIRPQPIYWLSE